MTHANKKQPHIFVRLIGKSKMGLNIKLLGVLIDNIFVLLGGLVF